MLTDIKVNRTLGTSDTVVLWTITLCFGKFNYWLTFKPGMTVKDVVQELLDLVSALVHRRMDNKEN